MAEVSQFRQLLHFTSSRFLLGQRPKSMIMGKSEKNCNWKPPIERNLRSGDVYRIHCWEFIELTINVLFFSTYFRYSDESKFIINFNWIDVPPWNLYLHLVIIFFQESICCSELHIINIFTFASQSVLLMLNFSIFECCKSERNRQF